MSQGQVSQPSLVNNGHEWAMLREGVLSKFLVWVGQNADHLGKLTLTHGTVHLLARPRWLSSSKQTQKIKACTAKVTLS